MTKKELVNTVATSAEITEKEAKQFIDTFLDSITKALKKGDNIRLVGFGTFSAIKRMARIGHNPKTGAEIKIPKRTVIKFKAGSNLSEKIN